MTNENKQEDAREMAPVAWGAFHFGGSRNGKLYAQCDTKDQIEAYIAQVHQSNDSITLRAAPLYTHPADCPRCAELTSVIDEQMVVTHLGVFNPGDDPKVAIHRLMCWSQDVGEYFAKDKLAALEAENARLAAMLPDPASLKGCTTIQDYRFAAMYYESQWRSCSHDFNTASSKDKAIIAQQADWIKKLKAKTKQLTNQIKANK